MTTHLTHRPYHGMCWVRPTLNKHKLMEHPALSCISFFHTYICMHKRDA